MKKFSAGLGSVVLLTAALVGCGSGDDDSDAATTNTCAVPANSSVAAADVESQSGLVSTHPQYGDILRTPKERFDNLPGYPFSPNYVDVDGIDGANLFMHYIDEGPRDGRVVLMMHGNPAWSYLVRDHVKPLVDAGYRVIALDLIGFGKSDKPASRASYTYVNQTAWVENFAKQLGLCDTTMFIQDWGGLIGLRVAMSQRERFAGVMVSNGGLNDGSIPEDPQFVQWRDVISEQIQNFSQLLEQATPTALSADDVRAYDAPYPGNEYTMGPRQMPKEVPFAATDPDTVINQEVLRQWAASDLPLLTVFSDPADPNNPPFAQSQKLLIDTAPGAAGQPHAILDPNVAGHFISEDVPDTVNDYLLAFVRSTRR
jgi:haloalkane dehalogenase